MEQNHGTCAWTTASWGSHVCLGFLKPTGDLILVWLTLSTTGWVRCRLVGLGAWEQNGVARTPWRVLLEGILLHPLLSVSSPPGCGRVGSDGLAALCNVSRLHRVMSLPLHHEHDAASQRFSLPISHAQGT